MLGQVLSCHRSNVLLKSMADKPGNEMLSVCHAIIVEYSSASIEQCRWYGKLSARCTCPFVAPF